MGGGGEYGRVDGGVGGGGEGKERGRMGREVGRGGSGGVGVSFSSKVDQLL